MHHPSHDEELTEERIKYYELQGTYILLLSWFEREGLSFFDQEGNFGENGEFDGAEGIDMVRNYMEKIELYEYCIELRDLREAYRIKFGR